MHDLHVVLGGTGAAGRAITSTLIAEGIDVRIVSRTRPTRVPSGTEHVIADLMDPVSAKEAVAGASVVHFAAQPNYGHWPSQFPPMLESVIRAAASARAKLVALDNCYAYGPVHEPMRESTPQQATDPRGRVRAAMADRLLAAHAAGEVRVSIGRASDFIGPDGADSAVMALAIDPVRRAGGRLRWIARDDVPHSVAYLPDVSRGLVALALDGRADGRIWHLPHAPAITGRTFLEMVNACLPDPRHTGVLSPLALLVASPFAAGPRGLRSILHQWDRPFVVDDGAFRSAFGIEPTPLAEAVEATVAATLAGGVS